MNVDRLLFRLFSVSSLMLVGAAPGLAGCSADAEPSGAGALAQDFPEHAAEVLEGGRAFVLGAEGFVVEAADPTLAPGPSGLALRLPAEGDGALRFTLASGMRAEVREIGASGAGALEGRAVRYGRGRGASYWAAVEQGYEEWLLLPPEPGGGQAVAAAWEVTGARLREVGDQVQLLDDAGVPRLRVTAPRAYAQSGREIEARLEVRGTQILLHVERGDEAALVDPLWSLTGSMAGKRGVAPAARLPDGRVLIIGGFTAGSGWAKTVEAYDPATGTFSPAAALNGARGGAKASVLDDGKILVTGGFDGNNNQFIYRDAELYDPQGSAWVQTSPMKQTRSLHGQVKLGDGRVMVTGGWNSGVEVRKTAESYDPSTGMWLQRAPMSAQHIGHAMVLLQSGKVLVMGGTTTVIAPGTQTKICEIYDPITNTWSAAPPMITARANFTATVLPDGKVLVVGGGDEFTGCFVGTAELYDPVANSWSPAGSIGTRCAHTATSLPDGRVVIAGGDKADQAWNTTWIYQPSTGAWDPGPATNVGRESHAAALLDDGRVLLAGGFAKLTAAPAFDSAELLTGAAGDPCASALTCASGFCVDGVCCDSACAGGPCDACSLAAGAPVDGICAQLSGAACDDGDACTQVDACDNGICAGVSPVICAPTDSCHEAGSCQPVSGVCDHPAKADGAPCPSGSCMGGVCIGATGTGGGGGGEGGAGGSTGTGGAGGSGGSGGTGGATGGESGSTSSGSTSSGSTSPASGCNGGCITAREAPGRGSLGFWLGLVFALGWRRAADRRSRAAVRAGSSWR